MGVKFRYLGYFVNTWLNNLKYTMAVFVAAYSSVCGSINNFGECNVGHVDAEAEEVIQWWLKSKSCQYDLPSQSSNHGFFAQSCSENTFWTALDAEPP